MDGEPSGAPVRPADKAKWIDFAGTCMWWAALGILAWQAYQLLWLGQWSQITILDGWKHLGLGKPQIHIRPDVQKIIDWGMNCALSLVLFLGGLALTLAARFRR